jgi:hypothetical protein
MGVMRFSVAGHEPPSDDLLRRVHMSGMEAIPWRSRCTYADGQLIIERDVSDSGNVHVPWSSPNCPELLLSTACLMEREQPYQLAVELARGTLNTLRNQIAAWQLAGLVVPGEVREQLSTASAHFAKAATSQHEPESAADHARLAIETALEATHAIGHSYARQAIAVRRRATPQLSTLMGVHLGRVVPAGDANDQICAAFNTAVLPLGWRQVEATEGRRNWDLADEQLAWCQQQNMKVASGPLLRLDAGGIPDWTYLWEGDFDNLLAFMVEHVKAVVERYRKRVQLWQVAARVNYGKILSLSEEQRLRIVVRAIEAVRDIDAKTPLVISFDQPWAEYLADHNLDLSPMHFADALVRADLGISGLGLEINAGYHPGTMPHSMLAYSQLLDRWSMLGLPLLVSLTTPSSSGDDPGATGKATVINGGPHTEVSPATQSAWVERHVPLILAKNCVQVLLWNQLSDQGPHEAPHGGLFDATGAPKPALAALAQIRKNHLA